MDNEKTVKIKGAESNIFSPTLNNPNDERVN